MMTTLETRQKIYRCELCMNKRDTGDINNAFGKAYSNIMLGYTAIATPGSKLFPEADVPAASFTLNLMGSLHLEHILEIDSKNPIALSLLASLELLYGAEDRVQQLLNRLLRCKSTDRSSLALGKIIQREMKKDKDEMNLPAILKKQFAVLKKLKKLQHE